MGSVIGLDVHKDSIAAAVLDQAGALTDAASFDNSSEGIDDLARWVRVHHPRRVGLEPAGGIGHRAGTILAADGVEVLLVPPRLSSREAKRLRTRGKSDAGDAVAIGRVLLREEHLPPFRPHGYTDGLRLLVEHRDQLHNERTRCANRLHAHLAIDIPGYQRTIGRRLDSRRSLVRAETLLPCLETTRRRLAARQLARLRELDVELKDVAQQIEALVADANTSITSIVGISSLNAARILGEVGDVRRFRSAATFAAANGTAPIPASSGRTDRHRLSRGGNRRLNRALYVVAITQARHEPRAVAYLDRKRAEGLAGHQWAREPDRKAHPCARSLSDQSPARRPPPMGTAARVLRPSSVSACCMTTICDRRCRMVPRVSRGARGDRTPEQKRTPGL